MMTPVYEQYLWLLDFICNSENKFKNAQIALALDSRMEGIREKITIKDFEKEALKRGIKVFPVHTRQAEKKGQDLFCATLVRRKGVYISLSSDENEGIGYLKIHWLRRVNEEGKADSLGSSPLFRREIEKTAVARHVPNLEHNNFREASSAVANDQVLRELEERAEYILSLGSDMKRLSKKELSKKVDGSICLSSPLGEEENDRCPYFNHLVSSEIEGAGSPIEEELRESLSRVISGINNPSQAGLSASVDSLCELLLDPQLGHPGITRFFDCLSRALDMAAIKTDLSALKNRILKLITNTLAERIKLLPRDSNEYPRCAHILFI